MSASRLPLAVAACLTLSFAGRLSAQAATQPADHGTNPVVAPDGRHVLFSSNRDGSKSYYLMADDGSALRKLVVAEQAAGKPVWSADGSRLQRAFVRGDTVRVVSMPVAGGASIETARVIGRDVKGAAVDAGLSRLIFGAGGWTTTQLFSVDLTSDASSKDAKQITSGGAFWCHALSPDGKQVAASHQDSTRQMQVWVLHVDGSNARAVTRFTAADGNPQCPAWSADGRRLAIQSDVADAADANKATAHIWVVDLSSGKATKLAPHTAPYADELPSWFPDGKRIAFQSNRTGAWEIWVMNVDGSNARQLTR